MQGGEDTSGLKIEFMALTLFGLWINYRIKKTCFEMT
tara:strand:- start:22641 stop:22751 length:111 start_codon:yes stop_codon:yes gene_type:complete